jgi:hypothetical protein
MISLLDSLSRSLKNSTSHITEQQLNWGKLIVIPKKIFAPSDDQPKLWDQGY